MACCSMVKWMFGPLKATEAFTNVVENWVPQILVLWTAFPVLRHLHDTTCNREFLWQSMLFVATNIVNQM